MGRPFLLSSFLRSPVQGILLESEGGTGFLGDLLLGELVLKVDEVMEGAFFLQRNRMRGPVVHPVVVKATSSKGLLQQVLDVNVVRVLIELQSLAVLQDRLKLGYTLSLSSTRQAFAERFGGRVHLGF